MSKENNLYLDPLSNFGFKHLFKTDSNKDILLEFLNVLFEGDRQIISFVHNHETDEPGDNREILLNVTCKDPGEHEFSLEIQRLTEQDFRERNQHFIDQHFNSPLFDGERKPDSYGIDNYLIGFVDFAISNSLKRQHFMDVGLKQKKADKNFSGTIGFKFIEAPTFYVREQSLKTELEKWIYLFKNLPFLEKRPECMDSIVLRKIFELAEVKGLSPQEVEEYDAELKLMEELKNSATEKSGQEEKKGRYYERRIGISPFDIVVKVTKLKPKEAKKLMHRFYKQKK